MSYQILVGLNVTDAEGYQQYRDAMAPLLEQYGGGFRYDFWTSEVLKAETEDAINRVFVIYFKDRESKQAFFSDPDYQPIRNRYYESSVKATTIIAEYEATGR